MNTETIAHPRLLHYGLVTANIDAMTDWYRNVLGMTVNHRAQIQPSEHRAPFAGFAFITNDERDHRLVLFESPGAVPDPDKRRQTGLQHVAFEYPTLDDLLGTYVRLKKKGIVPLWAADHGLAISVYYPDPDQNTVEITVNNFSDPWTATEYLRSEPAQPVAIDLDKVIAARQGGASDWDLHTRAITGEFASEASAHGRPRA